MISSRAFFFSQHHDNSTLSILSQPCSSFIGEYIVLSTAYLDVLLVGQSYRQSKSHSQSQSCTKSFNHSKQSAAKTLLSHVMSHLSFTACFYHDMHSTTICIITSSFFPPPHPYQIPTKKCTVIELWKEDVTCDWSSRGKWWRHIGHLGIFWRWWWIGVLGRKVTSELRVVCLKCWFYVQ